jgi:hypothetical protein
MWRASARALDVLLALVLGFGFAIGPVGALFARRAVVMLRIGAPGTLWKGPVPMMMGVAGTFVYALPLAFLLVALVEPMTGWSPGSKALRLRPSILRDHDASSRARWRDAIIRATPWWGLTAALLLGSWELAVVVVIASLSIPVARLLGVGRFLIQPRRIGT